MVKKNTKNNKEFQTKRSKVISDRLKAKSEELSTPKEYKTVFKFVIPLKPVTKKNSSQIVYKKALKDKDGNVIRAGGPALHPSMAYKAYEKACKPWLPVRMNIAVPMNIKAIYYIPSVMYSDLNNYHNALHDVLVHYQVIYDDNHYLVFGTDGSRVYQDKDFPRTEVYIQI